MHPSEESAGAPEMEMPRYISHKRVWALEILNVDGHRLVFQEPGYAAFTAPDEMFTRYQPVKGDFYVVYADGYKSFSPRKAFVEGYKPESIETGAP